MSSSFVYKIPSTRYQGSKRKLLPWLHEHICYLNFRSVLDLFGGTGVVSYLFKRAGKSVTYNDYLKFNYFRGKAIIENSQVRLSDDDIVSLLKGAGVGKSFIADTFQGMYFTDVENEWLDRVIGNIEALNRKYSGTTLEYKKALALYALFESCLVKRPFNLFHRANLNLRTSDVKRTFGNKTTWEQPFEKVFLRFIDEVNSLVFSNGCANIATNADALAVKNSGYDLVYIDPPYFCPKKNDGESNYANLYHFMEGLVNYRVWDNMIDRNTSNLRLKVSGNLWLNKGTAKENLERLISEFRESIIVISYKSPGIPSAEEIRDMLSKYKHNVRMHKKQYSYALNRSNGNGGKNLELLAIGY
ncbi:MAG: DNA adenine methylase [Dehalococcoidia bacterium]|nr:DNA adenine methylase [Dehalococcoidia bacterium]